ncbi:fatty acid desaturase-domain-containing protein [Fimicolochytrium jonesii]|uniref:fatty acid desaturase-domain-containing protein n=1 Tax=Fimicolochytrium jonesii TaxID=1396493 RepID=UPI0022FF13BD|nr:fatty acid desaturase-domain-containing protein [Fimicolochytrium jonesii]KAI8824445.1 fatty acid desaturase-domain-containing protein [Fimicolochytrium jonesii]
MPAQVISEGSSLRQRVGAEGAADASAQSKVSKGNVVESAKYADQWVKPNFTLNDIRAHVPAHCFKRDTARSFRYVYADVAMALVLGFLATKIHLLPEAARYFAWPAYWIAQGVVCTGLWVIAHECGHQAFSDKAWINNSVGYVLHSFLLVPYYSWKFSHSKHHKANAHMTKDQVFVPNKRSEFVEKLGPRQRPIDDHHDEAVWKEAPVVEFLNIVAMLTLGWPLYLLKNVTGQRFNQWTSHFRPDAPIFEPKQWFSVVLSDIGLAVMVGLLVLAGQIFGSSAVIFFYVIPYFNVNAWLVLITYLQHTDPKVPHYTENEWNFLLGAISTVDRDYGILNHFFHHIGDTHVAHHIFSTMPHYHAQEATAALQKALGKYYLKDTTPIWKALWNSRNTCRFVEDEGDVLWFKH